MKSRWVIYSLIVLLAILHQDFWWWDDATLVWGFMPIGLGYHGLYSVMASIVWALALFYCWPEELDEIEAEGESKPGQGGH